MEKSQQMKESRRQKKKKTLEQEEVQWERNVGMSYLTLTCAEYTPFHAITSKTNTPGFTCELACSGQPISVDQEAVI